MKNRIRLSFVMGLVFLSFLSLSVLADSDGSLQLNPGIITNQTGGISSGSGFPIRSHLFSKNLDARMKKKAKDEEDVTKTIQAVDFNKDSQNKWSQMSYHNVKVALFKDYSHNNGISTDFKPLASNNGMLLFLIATLPLMMLAGYVAKKFARRKRRK